MVTRYESVHLPHLVEEEGSVPSAVEKRRMFYGDLARFASLAESGVRRRTPISCRRRPDRKACRGLLVVRRRDVPPRVDWECPECSAGGHVTGWEETGDDLRRVRIPPAGDRLVPASAQALAALREVARIDETLVPLAYGAEVEGAAEPVLRVGDGEGALYARALFPHVLTVSSDRQREHLVAVLLALAEATGHVDPDRPGLVEFEPSVGERFAQALMALQDAALAEFFPAAPPRGPRSTVRRPPTTYRIKVTLRGVKPAIWRRLVVPSDVKLPVLHEVLQAAMGWQNAHLHCFQASDRTLAPPGELDEFYEDSSVVSLHDIAPRKGSRIRYEYDFGDGWMHDIVVEDVVDGRCERVRCLKGRRSCPPEDCGGPWHYAELCAALADPSHEEHEDLREWFPEGFDPDAFDLVWTDAQVQRVRL